MSRSLAALAGFSALVMATSGARADVVTLESLEQHALSGRASIASREARADAAEAHVDAIRAESRPRLSLDVGTTAQPGGRVTPFQCPGDAVGTTNCRAVTAPPLSSGMDAFLPSFRVTTGLRLDGMLYDFGRTRTRVRASRASAEAASAEVDAERESTIRGLRTAYLAWYGAFQRRRFTEAALVVAEQRVTALESALALGARSAADRDGARIEVARVRVELARARRAEADTRLVLARAAGAEIAETAEPDPELLTLGSPLRERAAPAAIGAMELRREALDAAVRLYQLRHAPILTAALRFGLTSTLVPNADPVAFPAYSVEIGLTVPLWDPRAGDHVLAEARAEAAALDSASRELVEATALVDERARVALAGADAELEAASELERLSREAAEGAEERWRIAGGSLDTVITARERERRAHEDRVRAELARIESVLAMQPYD